MRRIVRLIIGGSLLGALAGCSQSMILSPLDGGRPGRGGAFVMKRSAPMIRLDGKFYTGQWRNEETDAAALPPAHAPAPIHVGRYYGLRGAGGARVIDFTAKDGAKVVCRFNSEFGQGPGSGLCQSDEGRTFSLVVG